MRVVEEVQTDKPRILKPGEIQELSVVNETEDTFVFRQQVRFWTSLPDGRTVLAVGLVTGSVPEEKT
jgi:hypothetical protein